MGHKPPTQTLTLPCQSREQIIASLKLVYCGVMRKEDVNSGWSLQVAQERVQYFYTAIDNQGKSVTWK